jgi:signal transduction histidine kinase
MRRFFNQLTLSRILIAILGVATILYIISIVFLVPGDSYLLPFALCMLGICVLSWFTLARNQRLTGIVVVFSMAVLVSLTAPATNGHGYSPLMISLPSIVALILLDVPMVWMAGVVVYVLMAMRDGASGVYLEPRILTVYLMMLGGLVTSRMFIQTALNEAQAANRQLFRQNEGLEREVAARTQDVRTALADVQALLGERENLLKARSQAVTSVAHDLRNYINTLRGETTFLQWSYEDMQAGKEVAEHEQLPAIITRIDCAIDRVQEFCNALLETVRLEQGTLQLKIKETIAAYRAASASYGIHIRDRYRASHDVLVEADANYMRRVLENILGNAIKFTAHHLSEGHIEQGMITIDLRLNTTDAIIQIMDNGIGIAPADLEKIGQQFVKLTGVDGSGIGLHFVIGVMRAMHGDLRIASAGLGQGTTVTISIPLTPQTHEQIDPIITHEESLLPTPALHILS